jgi:hypothetical protein
MIVHAEQTFIARALNARNHLTWVQYQLKVKSMMFKMMIFVFQLLFTFLKVFCLLSYENVVFIFLVALSRRVNYSFITLAPLTL